MVRHSYALSAGQADPLGLLGIGEHQVPLRDIVSKGKMDSPWGREPEVDL